LHPQLRVDYGKCHHYHHLICHHRQHQHQHQHQHDQLPNMNTCVIYCIHYYQMKALLLLVTFVSSVWSLANIIAHMNMGSMALIDINDGMKKVASPLVLRRSKKEADKSAIAIAISSQKHTTTTTGGRPTIWRPHDFDSWNDDRRSKWLNIWKDPEPYYYSYPPPGMLKAGSTFNRLFQSLHLTILFDCI
jgi:hypothetical protein